MVLAAGFGTRLQPLTRVLPKPMFPVLGRPLLSHIFDLLLSANITETAVNIHHLPECIVNYFNNERSLQLNLHFSREERILGTAGGIKKMQSFLKDDPFILINSDIITDIDLNQVIDFHEQNNSKLTLVVRRDNSVEQYDPIEICEDGRIVHFIGASSKNLPENTAQVMFTGIQVIDPEIFERIPSGQFYGTTEDVFPKMVEDGLPVYGYLHKGYWKDMGNRENYLQVNIDALDGKVWLKGMPSYDSNEHLIIPPVLIGNNCRISESAQIGPHTIIGPNCTIKNGTLIENSILWEGATIGSDSKITRSIIAQNSTVDTGKDINEKSVV